MPDPSFSGRPGLTPDKLRIVRYAMLAMLLGFGAFAYYQSQHVAPVAPEDGGADLSLLRWVGLGLCAATIIGVAFVRQLSERADVAARPQLGLMGSAVGEATALFGAVYMILGGDILIYACGLVLFLSTWALLPADSEQV